VRALTKFATTIFELAPHWFDRQLDPTAVIFGTVDRPKIAATLPAP
jgi:hypothetical protein